MSGHRIRIAGLGLLGLASAISGCVARAEYDRVEFARRNAEQRVGELEREIADERANRSAVETDRNAALREKSTMMAYSENLKAENARLGDTLNKTQHYADEVLRKGIAEPTVIEVTKLPPELDKALKAFASDHPNVVEYIAEKGMVRWKSDLTFDLGSDSVKDAAGSALCEFGNILNRAGAAFEIVIVGHTDNVPVRTSNREHKSNWDLSCHRSIAVMNTLHRCGVGFERIGCMGYGEYRPRESNPSAGGNTKNRRVEVFLVSSKDSFAAMGMAPISSTVGTPAYAAPAVSTTDLNSLAGKPRSEGATRARTTAATGTPKKGATTPKSAPSKSAAPQPGAAQNNGGFTISPPAGSTPNNPPPVTPGNPKG